MENYSKEYAGALYSLAEEENREELFFRELEEVSALMGDNPDYMKLLSSPNLEKREKIRIIDDTFKGKVNIYLLNFIKILSEKYEIYVLPQCYRHYRGIFHEKHNILEVTAVTAVELSETLKEKLILKLEKITHKNILLINKVEPSCIGGVKIICKGSQIDGSVKNMFENMYDGLKKFDCVIGEGW